MSPSANCVVLEAETGSGKTEAALWRFLHLFEQGLVDGIYFALPTRVAATQMFDRVRRFRDSVFGKNGPPVVSGPCPAKSAQTKARGVRCRILVSSGTMRLKAPSGRRAGLPNIRNGF
ncbi:MAG: DEAD/DEAH box helicase [Acetobacteraceae bacterium]|nr:DEAD/DEAH box helicase [Acetobacteraceae bacterium]MBV8524189.1 DEAD/DEAH box helicase [Acetobacteraceae bacterium]